MAYREGAVHGAFRVRGGLKCGVWWVEFSRHSASHCTSFVRSSPICGRGSCNLLVE